MDKVPLFEQLASSQRILLAGAGGGYDIFCGLPLFFALESMGKTVYLANLSFSYLGLAQGRSFGTHIVEIDAETDGSSEYFPERYLCEWFASKGRQQVIYGIKKTGVQSLLPCYQALVEELDVDAIVLVDGGTDSLMRGDEPDLATPEEDILSIACVHRLNVPVKALVCLGFGVDTFHGVCHAYVMQAVAELSRSQAFWGAFSIFEQQPEVQLYKEACEFVFAKMPRSPSIVNASIISALEGAYGDVHRTERTRDSELWINPLMSMYWCFALDAVAQRNLYLDRLWDTTDINEISWHIEAFRQSLGNQIKDWKSMPV